MSPFIRFDIRPPMFILSQSALVAGLCDNDLHVWRRVIGYQLSQITSCNFSPPPGCSEYTPGKYFPLSVSTYGSFEKHAFVATPSKAKKQQTPFHNIETSLLQRQCLQKRRPPIGEWRSTTSLPASASARELSSPISRSPKVID